MGVVLCYPLGHEYFRAHRSYVKCAEQLAALGFPVIRFDYFGSGDSEGDIGHARLDDWLSEVTDVVEELKHSEPVSSIALGGMRFGGALALLAAQRIDAARALILWDPVIDGGRYVNDLRRLHARMLRDLERFARARHADECGEGELIGTRYRSRFLHELSGLDPHALSVAGIDDAILVNTTANAASESLLRRLNNGARWNGFESQRDYGWSDARRTTEAIMDPEAIRHITTSMNAIAA